MKTEQQYYGNVAALVTALAPLVEIAEAYDSNELDDEARKFWGKNSEHKNSRDPHKIILYAGRGGRTLLTLADCLKARQTVANSLSPQQGQAE